MWRLLANREEQGLAALVHHLSSDMLGPVSQPNWALCLL